MPKGDDGKPTTDLSKLASAAAKGDAASLAAAAFTKTKTAAETAQKDLVQKAVDAGTTIATNATAAKTTTTTTAKTI